MPYNQTCSPNIVSHPLQPHRQRLQNRARTQTLMSERITIHLAAICSTPKISHAGSVTHHGKKILKHNACTTRNLQKQRLEACTQALINRTSQQNQPQQTKPCSTNNVKIRIMHMLPGWAKREQRPTNCARSNEAVHAQLNSLAELQLFRAECPPQIYTSLLCSSNT